MPSIVDYLAPTFSGTDLGGMKDFAHASRLYADNVFALTPKAGWMYYVSFEINADAITDQTWANQQRVSEVGMLVKSAELPKFQAQLETMNQYNRKTIIQKNIVYQPVTLTLHDDMSNVVHNLWLNYYRYYFADSQWGGTGPIGTARDNTVGAYQNNKYKAGGTDNIFVPTDYGLNSQLVVSPFFRSITIYQLNRKIFTSYTLVNPLIQTWEHDKLNQEQGNRLAESRMQVGYEAVFYGAGKIKKDKPTGFAVFHYDNSPSPLSIAGGGNSSIFGPGGVIGGSLEVFGDVGNMLDPDAKTSPLDLIGTAIKGANLVKNIKGITKDSLRAEGYSLLNSTLRNIGQGGLNGLGANLNLHKSENYLTEGHFLGTPVIVTTSGGTQEGIPKVTQTGSLVNGLGGSLLVPGIGGVLGAVTGSINKLAAAGAAILATNLKKVTAPVGTNAAPGAYFKGATLLSGGDESYTASQVYNEDSNLEDIQAGLTQMETAFNADQEYAKQFVPSSDKYKALAAKAKSDAEITVIKADYNRAIDAYKSLQAQIDAKYSDRTRLQKLITDKESATSGSGSVV